jgi:hypothetical protein
MGPKQMRDGRLAYNEAARGSSDEELLLNIVRLRYLDTIEFMAITSITTQLEVSVGVGMEAGKNRDQLTVLGSAEAGWSSRPTFTFIPQRGPEFAEPLTNPVPIKTLIEVSAQSRTDVAVLMRLFVQNLNRFTNQIWKIDSEFMAAIRHLSEFQLAGEVFQGFVVGRRPISDPIDSDRVSGSDLVRAAEAGYRFEQATEGERLVLTASHRRPMIFIDPKAVSLPEFRQRLGLNPNSYAFYLEPGPEVAQRPDNTILIETRSLLDAMNYLTLGVEVPEAHVSRGWCLADWPAPGADVGSFEDFFRIQYSGQRPDAQLRVRYRDGWYFIPDQDHQSREVFFELAEAMRLVVAPGPGQAPVLTLPVGW